MSYNSDFLLRRMTLLHESRKIMPGICIVYPKKMTCLWGLLITTFVLKDDFSYIFRTLMSFSQHIVNRLQSHRSGGYCSGIFSKETWLAVNINEARSAPKGTRSWVVWVLKDFLAIYQRPSIRSSLNWKDTVKMSVCCLRTARVQ